MKIFIEMVSMSRSIIYFKLSLYKLAKKYPRLQKYLKNSFKKIKSACKKVEN